MGIWDYDFRTGRLTASPMFRQNLGLAPDADISWEQLQGAIHPEDRMRRQSALDHAIATGAEFDIEYRVMRPDGSTGWLHKRATVEYAADGRALRIAGVSFDVTAQHSAQQRIELSEASLRLAADAADIGTWDLDIATDTLTWSDRTRRMFGISPGRAVSMADFYSGLHPDDLQATSAAFATAFDPELRATYDVEYRTVGKEDGVVRWVAAKGRGLFADGVCRRAIGTAIDITARKQAAIRQEFLLDLMDQLRSSQDSAAILQAAGTALGAHLGASRVGYAQVEPGSSVAVLETCYTDGVAGCGRLNWPPSARPISHASKAARRSPYAILKPIRTRIRRSGPRSKPAPSSPCR